MTSMNILKSLNLLVAFMLELAMLAAFAYWGFHLDTNLFVKLLAGIGAPALIIVIWAMWAAPNASGRLSVPWLPLLKLALFGLAALSLYAGGKKDLAIEMFAVFVVSEALALAWHQE
ncbi:YrdB family protein [Candidatus Protofrankia californiensis]|uniref:YrdB family protein n=1 Tax=Candidatus Protofrankia californiensis TaxID=1839754 RepID=UPI001040FDE8|nr:YrdB family protein [Candidatus Protofrankia californiensis]